MTTLPAIRAAGVVLLRGSGDEAEVLIVHRPNREDWSLPKGKIDAGEHVVAAAIRECDQETGFTPILQIPLATQTYSVQSRPKVVNYWRARVRSEEGFTPDDEVEQRSGGSRPPAPRSTSPTPPTGASSPRRWASPTRCP